MNADTMGRRAARALLETTSRDPAVDIEAALESLYQLHRRRRAARGAALAGAFAVAATTIGIVQLADGLHDPQDLSGTAAFPPLGDGYEVITSSLSPTRTSEAVATYREGLPAVVLVRASGSSAFDVAWSAPTAHERGSGDLPFPAAVGWSPDGSRIAIVIGQERQRGDAVSDPMDLTLLTVNPDGTARETVADVGTCLCSTALPTLTWSGDEVVIAIPDGPDQGLHTEEMS